MDSADVPDGSEVPGLTLTVLGSSGTFPGPDTAATGFLVRSARTALVVDLGSGTLANLQRQIELRDLDAVVLSHEHADHWLDVPLLRTAMRYVLGLGDLPVYGTAGTRRLAEHLIGELAPTLRWKDIDASADLTVGDLRVRFSRTDHPVETLAVRVDGAGRSLLYTADTGAAWDPGSLGEDVDLLLCEASFAPADEDTFQHLSGRQAGALADGCRAGRLLLTHVVPGVDPDRQVCEAAKSFSGSVELAVTGRTFPV